MLNFANFVSKKIGASQRMKDEGEWMKEEKAEIQPSSVPDSPESWESEDFKSSDNSEKTDIDDVWQEIEKDIFSP